MPASLRNVEFRDQHGAQLSLEQSPGKALLLNFVFTRCGSVCPLQTRELAKVYDQLPSELRDRVQFLSVSLDPERDTAANLQAFAATNGATQESWRFVTTTQSATERLVAELQPRPKPSEGKVVSEAGAERTDDDSLRAAHGTDVYLFDRFGRLMQRYAGAPLDTKRLADDIVRLERVTS